MAGVVLGLPGPWAEDCREEADHYTTKIGGLPDWPIEEMGIDPKLLNCGVCGERLCLVAQAYSPVLGLMLKERVIYILGCPMANCGRDALSWRVLRVQKCDESIKALPSEDNCGPVSKTSNWWDGGLSVKGSGEHDDESGNDEDLLELSRALSEAVTLASHSKKKNATPRTKASGEATVTKPRVIDSSIPVMPCFYIYTQTKESSSDKGSVCANYSPLSIKEDVVPSSDHEDEMWEGETYEYDRALGVDRTYLKFRKQMDAYPEQCFRYSYGGHALLPTTNIGKPNTCRLCGSPRHYEMQLMSPLLYFLHQAADNSSAYSPEEWNWITLVVYTCSKLNFDGSFNPLDGGAGAGFVVRNNAGEIVCAGASPSSASSPIGAELHGCWLGLSAILVNPSIRSLWIEGDSKLAMEWLLRGVGDHFIVQSIVEMINKLEAVRISHILREGNKPADWLANLGRRSSSFEFMSVNFPPDLCYLVDWDNSPGLSVRIVVARPTANQEVAIAVGLYQRRPSSSSKTSKFMYNYGLEAILLVA